MLCVQDTASSNQATLQQLQGQFEQQQQVIQQQQENMVAMRAQVVQSDLSCAANSSACADLRQGLQQLQQHVESCCRDTASQGDQLAELSTQQKVRTMPRG